MIVLHFTIESQVVEPTGGEGKNKRFELFLEENRAAKFMMETIGEKYGKL